MRVQEFGEIGVVTIVVEVCVTIVVEVWGISFILLHIFFTYQYVKFSTWIIKNDVWFEWGIYGMRLFPVLDLISFGLGEDQKVEQE